MLTIINKAAVALVVTVLAIALLMGFQVISETWLGLVIFLETYVGSALAGVVGLVAVTPVTFVLLYGFKDPRKS